MMRGAQRWFWVVAVLAGAAAPPAFGQASHTLAEREAVSNERKELRENIEDIRKEIANSEKDRAEAVDVLKASEQAISDATRKLAEIKARQDQAGTELEQLEKQIVGREAEMGKSQKKLAALLRRQYASGGVTPWSALLSGDNPQDQGRTLGYLGYVSQARTAAIQAVRVELAQLQDLQDDAAARRAELDELAQQQQAQRQERVRQRAERQRVLDEVGVRLTAQRKEASRLTTDEERLSGLITEINRALEKQAAEAARKRAEEARLAREREARLAREREQTRLLAEKTAREIAARQARVAAQQQDAAQAASAMRSTFEQRDGGPASNPEPVAPAVPAPVLPQETVPVAAPPVVPTVVASLDPARRGTTPEAPAKGNFAAMKGSLRLPARGDLTGRFGESRPAGGTWRGVFIRAPEETPVHAVAAGTVVFSGWLRGFGNLLILDHGSEYLTVYGNNEAILKEVGDSVAGGETVASAGSSGGQPESGIYFELRHRGSPVDPLLWAKLR